jgi:hypothetical protein
MPEGMPPAAAGGPPPPSAGGAASPQAPMGVSSATGPTPNKGYEAQVVQTLGVFASKLPEMISMVGFSSDLGKELTNIMTKLAKHLPSGGGNDPTSERNVLNRMQQTNAQNMQQVQQVKPQMPPGGGGGAPPGGPPSMPMGATA